MAHFCGQIRGQTEMSLALLEKIQVSYLDEGATLGKCADTNTLMSRSANLRMYYANTGGVKATPHGPLALPKWFEV
jgi:hypothetical protein